MLSGPRSNTTSDHTNGSLHPVMLLLAPFMENIMSLSAWPLRQNEGERGVRLAAKWSREMRIPSGWQSPRWLFEKVSFALIWLFWGLVYFKANNMTFYLVHLRICCNSTSRKTCGAPECALFIYRKTPCILDVLIWKWFQSHNGQWKKSGLIVCYIGNCLERHCNWHKSFQKLINYANFQIK